MAQTVPPDLLQPEPLSLQQATAEFSKFAGTEQTTHKLENNYTTEVLALLQKF